VLYLTKLPNYQDFVPSTFDKLSLITEDLGCDNDRGNR
jgi:hypothetical protein